MIYCFLANGFEETEAIAPVDVLRRAGLEVKTVGVTGAYVLSSHGFVIKADVTAEQLDTKRLDDVQAVILPGGMPGTTNLYNSRLVHDVLDYMHENERLICAICAAPLILGRKGFLKGKSAVCYPGFESELKGAEVKNSLVCVDGSIITGRGPGAALEFGFAICEALCSKQTADEIRSSMQAV